MSINLMLQPPEDLHTGGDGQALWVRTIISLKVPSLLLFILFLEKKKIVFWVPGFFQQQIPCFGDGSGLWSRLGVHSRDASRWGVGGASVQETPRCKSLAVGRCWFADWNLKELCVINLSPVISSKEAAAPAWTSSLLQRERWTAAVNLLHVKMSSR